MKGLVDSAVSKDDEQVEAMFNHANVQLLTALKQETSASGSRAIEKAEQRISFAASPAEVTSGVTKDGTEEPTASDTLDPLPLGQKFRPRASMVRRIEETFQIDTSDSDSECDQGTNVAV